MNGTQFFVDTFIFLVYKTIYSVFIGGDEDMRIWHKCVVWVMVYVRVKDNVFAPVVVDGDPS